MVHTHMHVRMHSNEASLPGSTFHTSSATSYTVPDRSIMQVNRSTSGSTVMKRDETATITINLPWGT